MNDLWILLACASIVAIGIYLWFVWQKKSLQVEEDRILMDAKKRAEEYLETSRRQVEEINRVKEEVYREKEQSIAYREGLIGLQLQGILEQETNLKQRQERLNEREGEISFSRKNLDQEISEWRKRISQTAGISREEARKTLMNDVEKESIKDAIKLSKNIVETARNSAQEEASRLIATAIQRCAIAHSVDVDSTTMNIPNIDIKGRIIGRDGRNIKAFENHTGVTILVDDTPNAIVLSSFDPIRREIARRTMKTLLSDCKINPTRIEEVAKKITQEVHDCIIEAGKDAVLQVGLTPLPEAVSTMLGNLKFRFSYSQNILSHSIEVSLLAGLLASELGMDVNQARRAGLLHDIGKAISAQESEEAHAKAGAEFLERNMESPEVVECVAQHHDSINPSPLTCIVSAADAISAARPGARLETMQAYLKRCSDLEKLGNDMPTVSKCFVLQAGRELRVFVKPEETTDEQCSLLAKYISTRVQNNLQYHGKIRVTVIREHRCEEYAQ